MGFMGFAVGKQADEMARNLAGELAKKFPPSIESGKQKKISEKRITRILEGIYQKAVSYRDDRSLGVYSKARMGNTFRWELESLGYSEGFVKMATEGMVVYLTRE